MAQHKGRQGEWPTVRGNPPAFFAHPDGYFKSTRVVAGPLRMGTERRVGPSGLVPDGFSDYGLDRTTPRGFDPAGTSDSRVPAQEGSTLLSRELRRGR